MDKSFEISCNGTLVSAKGKLDRSAAEAVCQSMETGKLYTLSFEGVTDINFAGMRTLLNGRNGGKRFNIVNVNDSVAEKLDDTGVSSLISMCRKPKYLDMDKYQMFGESYLSKAYKSADGDAMIKVYSPGHSKELVYQEKAIAKAVMLFGIPTPLVGTVYESNGYIGLDFERIEGKQSFSRIIADNPDRLDEMASRFALRTKELHSKVCDTTRFNDRTLSYEQAVANYNEVTDKERERLLEFVRNVPKCSTCLHGDLQPSNIITSENTGDMWIDLSDFGYGNPLLDIGMFYMLSFLDPEEGTMHLFHYGNATAAKVWDVFAREYFGADTAEKQAEVKARVEPFAALHMIYLATTYGSQPWILSYVREKLLGEK